MLAAMTLTLPPQAAMRPRAPTVVELWAGGGMLLWALYATVFLRTTSATFGEALLDAAANVVPLALLAVAVRALLKAEVMRRPAPMQMAWHAALAPAFALTWYALVVVSLGLSRGVRGGGWTPEGFAGPAVTWQVFQGLVLYAAIACACYAVRGGRLATELMAPLPPTNAATPAMRRYLIRQGEALTPVNVEDIVTITGAQDYAEVTTVGGRRHLVRLSLGELEARLDPTSFVRVHRSAILNLGRLERTEPAGGGRLLAHMTDGQHVHVSRSGVQALRRFLI